MRSPARSSGARRGPWHTVAALATMLALAASASACGGDSDSDDADSDAQSAGALTPVSLQLQWVAQAQFAGFYAAVDQGYYEDEGLDVTLVEGGPDIVPQDVLAAGDVDYAVAWVPKVLGSIEQGAAITDVAQIFERSGTLQISFKEQEITTPADLKGKKVGSWGFGNEWELFAGMQEAGVDVEDVDLVQQAFDMNAFLSGDIDAAQAMTYNEYAQVLESTNPDTGKLYQSEDFNVIDWNEVGTAMLQDALWASSERLADDPAYAEQTVRFIKASILGWIYARDNVEEAAAIVTEAGSQLGTSHQLWMTNEVNKLIWPSTNGIGVTDAAAWDQTVEIALNTENETGDTIISEQPPATAYTNEYVEEALEQLVEEEIDVIAEDFVPREVILQAGGS